MNELYVELTPEFNITTLSRVLYKELRSGEEMQFDTGEYWGFVCCKRGVVKLTINDAFFELHPSQTIFFAPASRVLVISNNQASNINILSFGIDSDILSGFLGKVLQLSDESRTFLAILIKEAKYCFNIDPKDINYGGYGTLTKSREQLFGSEHMLKNLLEQYIIYVHRHEEMRSSKGSFDIVREILIQTHLTHDNELTRYLDFLEKNIRNLITIDELCQEFHSSASYIQKLFKRVSNGGVIDYHNRMKIEYAKILIRESNMNFAQIADYLGYGSVQYFSRVFKKTLNMTPSEYRKIIKGML